MVVMLIYRRLEIENWVLISIDRVLLPVAIWEKKQTHFISKMAIMWAGMGVIELYGTYLLLVGFIVNSKV